MRCLSQSSLIVALLLSLSVLMFLSLPSADATCSCNVPAGVSCDKTRCAECKTQVNSCTCWTGCDKGGCSSGYTEIDSCYWGCCTFRVKEKCKKEQTVVANSCKSCLVNHYGSTCAPCGPSLTNVCNGHGMSLSLPFFYFLFLLVSISLLALFSAPVLSLSLSLSTATLSLSLTLNPRLSLSLSHTLSTASLFPSHPSQEPVTTVSVVTAPATVTPLTTMVLSVNTVQP